MRNNCGDVREKETTFLVPRVSLRSLITGSAVHIKMSNLSWCWRTEEMGYKHQKLGKLWQSLNALTALAVSKAEWDTSLMLKIWLFRRWWSKRMKQKFVQGDYRTQRAKGRVGRTEMGCKPAPAICGTRDSLLTWRVKLSTTLENNARCHSSRDERVESC